MADVFSRAQRSRVMAAVRARGNKATELRLVTILRSFGIRGWRRHRPLAGNPDFVFPQARLALFVDGCFWHGCQRHCRIPVGNREYWKLKIERNRARDHATTKRLRAGGWRVLRIWEHSLRAPNRVAQRVRAALRDG